MLKMILLLEIKLVTAAVDTNKWSCVIEIDASNTLEDLHHIIQTAVDFDNDHLYEFMIAKTPQSRNSIRFCDDDEESDNSVTDPTLGEIFPLPPKMYLHYLFDYGDMWRFKILYKGASKRMPNVTYPRIISEKGTKPEQYGRWEDEE